MSLILVMGVKGRRVAVVEELSKTIISFQKVDQKSKDRTLTITGNSQESIDHAKRLIEQTIRRNISPCRVCYLRILSVYYFHTFLLPICAIKFPNVDNRLSCKRH